MEYHNQALALKQKIYPKNHPATAYSMLNIGNIMLVIHNIDSAQILFEQSLDMLQKTYGYQHRDIADVKENIYKLKRVQNKYKEAINSAKEAFEIQRQHFFNNNVALTEKESQAFYRNVRSSAANYLSCFIDYGVLSDTIIDEAAEVILSTKGEISDDLFFRQKSLFSKENRELAPLLDTLKAIRSEFAQLFVSGPEIDVSQYTDYLDSIAIVSERLDSELTGRSRQYRIEKGTKRVTAEKLSGLLPEKTTLVEFYNFYYQDVSSMDLVPRYIALIIKKGSRPIILDLGAADKIDSLVFEIRRHLNWVAMYRPVVSQEDFDEYSELSKTLYKMIWDPLNSYLSDGEFVLIAPDGSLNSISFAALIDNDNNFLIKSKAIQYLSSGRDLLRYQGKIVSSKGLLASGDPDYNATVEARQAGYKVFKRNNETVKNNIFRSSCDQLEELQVGPLPWTKTEVTEIKDWWTVSSREPVKVLLGVNASEELLKKELEKKRVIHLATHGFYLNSDCYRRDIPDKKVVDQMYVGENPLLMSGLLLAGANLHNTDKDKTASEDGILTAYEVASINLIGVDNIILSACESGLGDVYPGEGVYGLRRAFLMSGARLVVSALWKVPDEMTSHLMRELYSDIKLPVYQRLRKGQLKLIKQAIDTNRPAHPISWGGFITTGDWR